MAPTSHSLSPTTTCSIGLDLNKLLVPTKPRESDYINQGGAYYDPDKDEAQNAAAFDEALQKWETMSPITGIFKSFSDAPGGFSEELKEITVSLGAEYSYNDQFFVRMGYNYENASKGGRSYFGFGAGFSLNVVRLDASYSLATAQSSPSTRPCASPSASTWTASATFSENAADILPDTQNNPRQGQVSPINEYIFSGSNK